MNKKMVVLSIATTIATLTHSEIREVTFPKDEIPSENPRIERREGTVTHVEVFGVFDEQENGSVVVPVIESTGDMAESELDQFVRSAQIQLSVLPTWKGLYDSATNKLAEAESDAKKQKALEKAAVKFGKNLEKERKNWEKYRDKAATEEEREFWQTLLDTLPVPNNEGK